MPREQSAVIELDPQLEKQRGAIYLYRVHCVALLAYEPLMIGHTVIIPYSEVGVLEKLTNEEKLDILDTMGEVKKRLHEEFDYTNFITILNQGYPLQKVQRFHLHVIPMREGECYTDRLATLNECKQGLKDLDLEEITEKLRR